MVKLIKYYYKSILLFILLANDVKSQKWSSIANFGGSARYCSVAFSIGNKGYVGTGWDSNCKSDFWEYDPSTNTWTEKASFPGTPRYVGVGFSIGNKGYITTGYDCGAYTNDLWEYDPESDTWSQKAPFPSTVRAVAVGFSIGNKGYVGLGKDYDSLRTDFWEYDPLTDNWNQKANFGGSARRYAVGFSIGEKGYIGTGNDGSNSTDVTKDFWEYDPSTDNWSQKTDFPGKARYVSVGFSLNNKGYIGLGWDGELTNIYQKDFFEYDPTNDTWKEIDTLTGPAKEHAVAFSIGNAAYVGTGWNGYGLSGGFWKYTLPTPEPEVTKLEIFPNPVKDKFTITNPGNTISYIEIFGLSGKRLLSAIPEEKSILSVSLAGIASGIYDVRLTTKEGTIHKKIIVE